MSALVNCVKSEVTIAECNQVTTHRIRLMLFADTTYACLLFIYVIFAILKLIYFSWKYSRLEARSHMVYFVASSLGLLTALPLIIDSLTVFINNTSNYEELRLPYYEDFVAKVLPSVLYLATKKNEDCFNCFNRLAPQRYSVIQYSKQEQKLGFIDQSDNLFQSQNRGRASVGFLGRSDRFSLLL